MELEPIHCPDCRRIDVASIVAVLLGNNVTAAATLPVRVVLQKLKKDRKPRLGGVRLCNQSKNLVHKFNPFSDGSFLHSFNLSFPHHVHNFISP